MNSSKRQLDNRTDASKAMTEGKAWEEACDLKNRRAKALPLPFLVEEGVSSTHRGRQRKRGAEESRRLAVPADGAAPRVRLAWLSLPALWIGRVLTIGLIGCSPWNYGMVHWQSQIILLPWCACILCLGVCSLPASGGRLADLLRSPVTWGLVLLVLLAGLQTVVLPEAIWSRIASGAKWESVIAAQAAEIQQLLPPARSPLVELEEMESRPEGELGVHFPRTLSIHPWQTRASLSVLASAVALYLAAGCLFTRKTGSMLLLLAVAGSTLAFALWGLIDNFVGEKGTQGFSSLVSPNSSPQLLAVGFGAHLGLLNWWANRRRQTELANYSTTYPSVNPIARLRRRVDAMIADLDIWTAALAVGMAVLFVGVIATASRGGMVGFLAGGLLFGLASLLTQTRASGSVRAGAGGALLLVALGAGVAVAMLGLGEVAGKELESINEEAYVRGDVRFELWRWSVSEPAYWWTGAGLGTYHFAILPCYEKLLGTWFYHAENVYIEVFTEFGVLGLIAAAGVVLGLVSKALTSKRRGANELLWPAMVFSGLTVSLQWMADFSLVIPAIFIPLAAMAGAFVGDSGQTLFMKQRRRDARDAARRSPEAREQAANEPLALPPQRSKMKLYAAWAGLVVGMLVSIFQGWSALQNFAQSERLDMRLAIQKADQWEKGPLAIVAGAFNDLAGEHPEVALNLGRLRQRIVGLSIASSEYWPSMIDDKTRKRLSAPHVVAAAVRGGSQGSLAELEEVLGQVPDELQDLAQCSQLFGRLDGVCPLDWRLYWGQIRSHLGQMSRGEVATAYAMLQLCGRHQINLLEAAGMSALISGDEEVGRRLLAASSAGQPSRVFRLLRNLPWMSRGDVLAVVPDRLLLAQLLERLAASRSGQATKEMGEELASELDVEELSATAQSEGDWTAVAYLAELQGKLPAAIRAMEQAIVKSPFKSILRYRLATLLRANQQGEQALVELEQIGSELEKNPKYRRLEQELREAVGGAE